MLFLVIIPPRGEIGEFLAGESMQINYDGITIMVAFQFIPLSQGETLFFVIINTFFTFQSTPLSRGETHTRLRDWLTPGHFNPLPSHEGRRNTAHRHSATAYFNPLPSHEGRRDPAAAGKDLHQISIHSPLTRGDAFTIDFSSLNRLFQSTPLSRGETFSSTNSSTEISFQSTPLSRGETDRV